MSTQPPSSGHQRQHHGSTAPPLAVPAGTLLIDTYEILEHLNTGGMGEVYRGVNIHNDEVVAIKIVLPALAHDETILSLFQKESTVLRRIAHDAIVRYEVFTRDRALDRPCLIMEYAEGPSLSDRMELGPLDLAEIMVLLQRLTAGLDVAHRGGVVHRDLSPDNVILCNGEVAQAKIIDFGIAKASTPGGRTLIGGQFAGKPGYVAPEQLGLYDGHVTGQADIYSMGLLAAAAALGHPLDMGDSPAAAVMARVKVPDLDGIDPELVPLLEWMLQPDPAHRPGSMAEISAWITEHFSDLIPPEAPPSNTFAPRPISPRSQSPGRSAPPPGPARSAPPPASAPPAPDTDAPACPVPPRDYQPTVLADRPPMPFPGGGADADQHTDPPAATRIADTPEATGPDSLEDADSPPATPQDTPPEAIPAVPDHPEQPPLARPPARAAPLPGGAEIAAKLTAPPEPPPPEPPRQPSPRL